MINVWECWMNCYYNCFKYDNFFRRRRYWFGNNDDRPKTLGDSKPKHYHIYMFTEKAIKPQSQIYVLTTSSLYCYIAAKILICCRWWSSHKCLNGWIYLRWSLIKLLRSSIVHYKIIKYCYCSVAFILLSLERIAILHVNIDKVSNAYSLATSISTRCYCNKQKNWLDYWSQLNENDKTVIFDRFFFITNFYALKLWLTLITKFGGDILIEN